MKMFWTFLTNEWDAIATSGYIQVSINGSLTTTYDEMWFKIIDKHFKFSIKEFALVTGLKCHGDDNISMYNISHSWIKHPFFKHRKSVYRWDIENTFKNLIVDTTDEDAVKLGIIYLISSLLYTTTSGCVVADEILNLIDSPHGNIPMGNELFRITFKYLKLTLAKPTQKSNIQRE